MFEDQVHDDFQHLVHAETAAQRRAELVKDFEIGHGDGGGFGDGQDHGIVRRLNGVHDGAVHSRLGAGQCDIAAAGAA